jgi:hypothetical protein
MSFSASNVVRFPKPKKASSIDRLAARRAYRAGIDELAFNAIEQAFKDSAGIPGSEEILLKDAQLLFVAAMRRALSRAIK